jgi:hypothetical protein
MYTNPTPIVRTGRRDIHIPAGGSATIGGDPYHPDVKVYDAQGQPFTYTGRMLTFVQP